MTWSDTAYAAAQKIHEQRQRDDPTHDAGGCVCCCFDCEDLDLGTEADDIEADDLPEPLTTEKGET